jgi:hypothetical protein
LSTSLWPSPVADRTNGSEPDNDAARQLADRMLPAGTPRRRPQPPPRWAIVFKFTHPAWPVAALLAAYPLWWALGFGDFIFIAMAVPMVVRMVTWRARRGRPLRVPPGFGWWLLFLACSLAGAATLSLTAPETITSAVGTRWLSFAVRFLSYLSVTVLLLYAGNLTERELPRQRLAWLLGFAAIYTTAGGVAGVVAPHLGFNSPLLLVLPHHVQANPYILAEMHPSLAQVQNVLGGTVNGRPDAPFPYTNTWGNCIALLLPWLITAWWIRGTRRQRRIAVAVLVISIVPIIYSLNRGLWLALIFSVLYLSLRLAARGRVALLATICAGLLAAVLIVLVTPLQGLVTQRLQNGHSNARRGQTALVSLVDARASPFIGFGDTRHQAGSVSSIAVGRTAKCPQCGQVSVGNNGQLWLLLICSGFVGAGLYVGFFAYGSWRFWRDDTPEGMAGVLVLLLTFVFMIAYDAVGAPLGFTMVAYALLWRNEQARRERPKRVTPGHPLIGGPLIGGRARARIAR